LTEPILQTLIEQVAESRLLQDAPRPVVSALMAGSEHRALATNEVLLRAGDENTTLYLIAAGSVNVHVPGAEQPYVRLGPGECVGELSLIDGQRVSADVAAHEPATVIGIDREQLWWAIESAPAVARNLLRILSGRLRHDDVALGESKRLQRQFEHIATIDGLTGLRNRRWLDETFPRQLERAARVNEPVALLVIDIDHFKVLNDQHGHLTGDAVLCSLSQLMTRHLRPADLLARYGGEEFAVMLPDTDATTARVIAERLRETIESADRDSSGLPTITVSVGLASSQAGDTVRMLLARADQALYRAKRSGRNRTSD
jgi:diguanylate cyclase (GGDEF)-like protein